MPLYIIYAPEGETFEIEADNFEVTEKSDLFLFNYGTDDKKIGRGYFLSEKWENIISCPIVK